MSFFDDLSQADVYERESSYQVNNGMRLIHKLQIPQGANVLDLGCGTGALSKVLSGYVGREGTVVAVDPDEERLKLARTKYNAPNIEYLQADDKSFPLKQYDAVFCNAVIHWIAEKKEVFERVFRALHPGGKFVFTTPNGTFPVPNIGKKLFDEMVGPEFRPWMFTKVQKYLTVDEYRSMAKNTGFQELSVTIGQVQLQWANLDDYVKKMYGWCGGKFDPSQFNKKSYQSLKKISGSGPILAEQLFERLEVILIKPREL